MIKKTFVTLLLLLIAIQFIRPARNNGSLRGPHDISHYVGVPDTVQKILVVSCYDCHSNHTAYPWYMNINPVGFWLKDHIDDGKRALNFSDLSNFPKKKLIRRLGDISKQLDRKEMPLTSYTLIHRYAILDSGQVRLVENWTMTAKKQLDSLSQ